MQLILKFLFFYFTKHYLLKFEGPQYRPAGMHIENPLNQILAVKYNLTVGLEHPDDFKFNPVNKVFFLHARYYKLWWVRGILFDRCKHKWLLYLLFSFFLSKQKQWLLCADWLRICGFPIMVECLQCIIE